MRYSLFTKLFFVLGVFFLFPSQAQAAKPEEILSSCIQIYNGGTSCYQSDVITINKKVLKPTLDVTNNQKLSADDFIENSSLTQPFTKANSLSAFRLEIANLSDRELKDIVVTDILPEKYLTYVTSEGTYDTKTRTTSFNLDSLKAGETHFFTIQVMTAMGTFLPSDPICTVNQAKVNANDKIFFILPKAVESQDNARFCLTKNESGSTLLPDNTPQKTIPDKSTGGLPVQETAPVGKTPETGAETLALFGLISSGLAGIFFRRKTLS